MTGATRGRRIAAFVAVATVGLLIATSPLASATTVMNAPYKGAWTNSASISHDGCGKAKQGAVAWSMSTGTGGIGLSSAIAPHCSNTFGGVGTYSSGNSWSRIEVAVKLKPLTTGYHSVNPVISLSWTEAVKVVNGSCLAKAQPYTYGTYYKSGANSYWYNTTGYSSYCDSSANVNPYANFWIDDVTSNTQIYPTSGSNYWYNNTYAYTQNSTGWYSNHNTYYINGNWSYYNYTYSNNYSYSTPTLSSSGAGTAVLSPYFNTTFASSDVYALVFYVQGYTYAQDQNWASGGSASASLNFGTLGNGVTLSKIVIA